MGGGGKHCTFAVCIMPTDSSSVSVVKESYTSLKEDVGFKQKGRVVLLGYFNARVLRSTDGNDVIRMFGEETCNTSGNKLISFLNEVELVIRNLRLLEP